nr:endonuclease/exonuclease/phosphatase family protein [uncultured Flavobacterium sp.]
MKKFFVLSLFLFFFVHLGFSQVTLVSWNLKNFGKSKTNEQIAYMANILCDYDIVVIQEVVTGLAGAQKVAQLADELNRKGNKWDYVVSDPTKSTGQRSERYAYLWKAKNIKLKGRPFLDKKFEQQIEREPYMATFEYKNKEFTVASFHAVPKSSKPETEIKYLKFFPKEYANLFFFVGDFNLSQSHSVFNPLKDLGFNPLFKNQKTSLKQECINGECLANPLDHIFYKNEKVKVLNQGVLLFYKDFHNLKEARKLSDHIPVYIEFNLK